MKSRKFEKVFTSVLKVILAKILEDHETFADFWNNLLPLWRNYLFSPLEMVFGNQQRTTQGLKRFINCKGCILHDSVTYSNTIFFYSVKYILFNLSFEGHSQIN